MAQGRRWLWNPLGVALAVIVAWTAAAWSLDLASGAESPPVQSSREARTTQSPFACSEGDTPDACAAGVSVITGTITSGNFAFLPELYPNPVVVLIDVTPRIQGNHADFVPDTAQILGHFTEPLFPGPGQARINLPIVPTGASIDLDNDGAEDSGVQVFAMQMASNLMNDSYLQQIEQMADVGSYITDVATGAILQGTFLVHAPDDAQGFPTGWGEDGIWFTADDPAAPLPQGYTVATLNADGTVSLDRSPVGVMNSVERGEVKALDFSEQGILESFHSLIDALKVRYAYTELRGLDWEEIRAHYLPAVTEADAGQDLSAYFILLDELAKSIQDSHVSVKSTNPQISIAPILRYAAQTAGTVGAATVAVTDEETGEIGDRIFVVSVGEETPAAEAGWAPGTEIIAIDGEPVAARLESVPLLLGLGTAEGRRVMQAASILSFPLSSTVTIDYRLPDSTEVLSATMTAGDYSAGPAISLAPSQKPIAFEPNGDYAIVRWSDFMGYVVPKLAVLEEALAIEQVRSNSGVIIDLRGNTGGWVALYETMASYFFTEDNPMPFHVFDFYYYDQESGTHIAQFAADYQLVAPRPELAYTGPVVVLVDSSCASACEYFTQHLRLLDRATVIGQYTTSGAGGFIDRIKMPGEITFQFTRGGTYFAGTDEPNLEAKGVIPDIRVPVTVETELAKRLGEDPVMDVALEYLQAQSSRITQHTWKWVASYDTDQQLVSVENPDAYTAKFEIDGSVAVNADCNSVSGTYQREESDRISITLDTTSLTECGSESESEEFLHALGTALAESYEEDSLGLLTDPSSGWIGLLFEPAE